MVLYGVGVWACLFGWKGVQGGIIMSSSMACALYFSSFKFAPFSSNARLQLRHPLPLLPQPVVGCTCYLMLIPHEFG